MRSARKTFGFSGSQWGWLVLYPIICGGASVCANLCLSDFFSGWVVGLIVMYVLTVGTNVLEMLVDHREKED